MLLRLNPARPLAHGLIGGGLGLAGIALATLLLKALSFEESSYSVALVFIVIVLVVASRYGLGPALTVSATGFFCLNFFFIPPFYTLAIDSWAGVVAVIGFGVVALLTSQIASQARRQTLQAELRQRETAALGELTMTVLGQVQAEPIFERLVAQVAQAVSAGLVHLYLAPAQSSSLVLRASYSRARLTDPFEKGLVEVAFQTRQASYHRLENGWTAYLPLVRGSQGLGVLSIFVEPAHLKTVWERLAAEPRPIWDGAVQDWLAILANQVALAVEHARLLEESAQVASLREADRLKSALLASVSHELRTPITAIKTAVAGLGDPEIEPVEQTEYRSIIDGEADRLSRLISNLLDLSRLEAGTLRPEKGLYYLPEIAGGTLERLTRSGIIAPGQIAAHYAPALPLLPLDYLQIEQVVTNLVENAAKYSPPGSPIEITVEPVSGGLQTSVADRGRGIPPTELENIFDKFYRVAAPDQAPVSGSGLGLAICKGIIEAHGGRIWAANRPGGGAVFTFWLPVSKSREELTTRTQDIKDSGH